MEWIWGEKFIAVQNDGFSTANENGYVKWEEVEMKKIIMKWNLTLSVMGNVVNQISRDVSNWAIMTEIHGDWAHELLSKPIIMEIKSH